MRQSFVVVSIAVVLAMATTGCTSAADQAALPDSPKEAAVVAPTLASITEAVLADAASQTGLEKAALTVEGAEEVTWADGSLGCPSPSLSYTMAQVPGYRVRVRAGDRVLDYHANRRGHFVLCPSERAVDPVGLVAF
jgi:hypothetical protein